jgi:hypothetical protein
MKTLFLIAATLILFSERNEVDKHNVEVNLHFVGSTPGDDVIKNILSIPQNTNVDFIRWDLHLSDERTFLLKINFGVNKPNTLTFENGGLSKSYQGSYSTIADKGKSFFKLASSGLPSGVQMMKMSENIFHIADGDNRLLVGNGGWSYVLNNAKPVAAQSPLATSAKPTAEPVSIFVGRTPCQELATAYGMKVTDECFKLKFKITLMRDTQTLQPLRYIMRQIVDNQPEDISGTWSIENGFNGNPNAVIYKLSASVTKKEISLLAVDDDILYFLQTPDVPFVGNENFSYALNRSAN